METGRKPTRKQERSCLQIIWFAPCLQPLMVLLFWPQLAGGKAAAQDRNHLFTG